MVSCTFFGHRDAPCSVEPKIKNAIVELIEVHGLNDRFLKEKAIKKGKCVIELSL